MRLRKLNDCSAVILASGKGSRLGSYCEDKPKCLIKFNGVPFIHYLINWIIKSGIYNIVITAHFHGEQIVREVEKYWDNVSVVLEDELVSTVASAYHGVSKIYTPYAFVMVADTVWDVGLLDLYNLRLAKMADAIVLATRRKSVSNFGLVKTLNTGQVVSMYESSKSRNIQYDIKGSAMGLYIVRTQKFLASLNIKKDRTFERESISCLIPKVWVLWSESLYIDYGEPKRLEYLLNNQYLITKHFGSFP